MSDTSSSDYHRIKSYDDVRRFVDEFRKRVKTGQFIVSEREDKNLPFMRTHNLVDRRRQANLLLGICAEDFVHAVPSRLEGNEGQELYVFAKQCTLHEMLKGLVERLVYIKVDMITGKKQMAIVVSLHEAEEAPESYPYK